ncbi:hypothetical protein HPG69_003889 [Diceros bicornis minor]|uniref:small monomeric GTPase n=1 Tax=Diceros bicornis minor TaxID=77932 RepID=A0A7J7EU04_DICBM|nr:hypothetical protein HPG69_003889 [Diceros bicornis minor]
MSLASPQEHHLTWKGCISALRWRAWERGPCALCSHVALADGGRCPLEAQQPENVGPSKQSGSVDFKIKTVELRGKKIRLQIWIKTFFDIVTQQVERKYWRQVHCLKQCMPRFGVGSSPYAVAVVICFVHKDTAGQERFNSITSAYYRSAKGIILVYDITKKETFDDLPKWMKMIDKYASEDAELLLVGNKLDCETDREITRQQGEKFAQQITGMRFCEASAKDNFNVDEIFLKLVDDILKKMPLDILRNELSNSILSLQPEPEIPPELPPPRPHVRHGPHSEIVTHSCGHISHDQLRKGMGAVGDTKRRMMSKESKEAWRGGKQGTNFQRGTVPVRLGKECKEDTAASGTAQGTKRLQV